MNPPWNNWYHVNGNTFGTWLRGDPRGFRERAHRRHVEGDYKNPPPPGTYGRLLARSKCLMHDEPVTLSASQRRCVCQAIVTKLLEDGIKVIALAVDGRHFHVLAKFPDQRPRHWIGRAKMHASMLMRGAKGHSRRWARGCRALPIRDRAHQLNVFNYIVRHANAGAAVWTFREPNPGLR